MRTVGPRALLLLVVIPLAFVLAACTSPLQGTSSLAGSSSSTGGSSVIGLISGSGVVKIPAVPSRDISLVTFVSAPRGMNTGFTPTAQGWIISGRITPISGSRAGGTSQPPPRPQPSRSPQTPQPRQIRPSPQAVQPRQTGRPGKPGNPGKDPDVTVSGDTGRAPGGGSKPTGRTSSVVSAGQNTAPAPGTPASDSATAAPCGAAATSGGVAVAPGGVYVAPGGVYAPGATINLIMAGDKKPVEVPQKPAPGVQVPRQTASSLSVDSASSQGSSKGGQQGSRAAEADSTQDAYAALPLGGVGSASSDEDPLATALDGSNGSTGTRSTAPADTDSTPAAPADTSSTPAAPTDTGNTPAAPTETNSTPAASTDTGSETGS